MDISGKKVFEENNQLIKINDEGKKELVWSGKTQVIPDEIKQEYGELMEVFKNDPNFNYLPFTF